METDSELLGHVLVPVAHDEDARLTASALEQYDPEQVTALHVVEDASNESDETLDGEPVSVSEEAFAALHEVFPDAETHTAYSTSVVEAIFENATELDATAIAYRSRGGGRLLHFLSGDLSLKLVTKAPVPVVALPVESD
jgi:nucleotide-binding universal stress UspA family protein